MITDTLLNRLEKVKTRGLNTWLACCPAHEDHDPSLSIRLTEQGNLLIYCFAGCPPASILTAVGLELADLFPPETRNKYQQSLPPAQHRAFSWSDLIKYISKDMEEVRTATLLLAEGEKLKETDLKNLHWTANHLGEALRRALSHA